MLYLNGGIQPFVDQIKGANIIDIPLNKRAYIFYHMAKQEVHDPDFYTLMETRLIKDPNSSE